MTFDSCSLNEFPELPTTPDEPSANLTQTQSLNCAQKSQKTNDEDNSSTDTTTTTTLVGDDQSAATTLNSTASAAVGNCVTSTTLPSKLEKLEKLEWDEIDDLLQVERRHNEKDKVYETMPVRLPSSSSATTSSSASTPTSCSTTPTSEASSKTISNQNNTDSTNIEENGVHSAQSPSKSSSSTTTSSASSSSTSSDNFLTATASLTNTTTTTNNQTTTDTTTVDNYETSDDATLKPMDFEDFKRSVHQDYVHGANSCFMEPNDDTLKRNQPIDPSRINDSLKFYNSNSKNSAMSKSFNCEHALRSIDVSLINDTLSLRSSMAEGSSPLKRSPYVLQKSGSAQAQLLTNGRYEKALNRSKSGPSCVDLSSSDDDDAGDYTLKATGHQQISATIRKSDIPPRFIQINMNCYPAAKVTSDSGVPSSSDCDSLRHEEGYNNVNSITSHSGAMAGDELTQSEEMFTATNGAASANHQQRNEQHHDLDEDQPLHITEDGVVLRRPPRTGAAAIKRRSGNRR